jgi:hypothetical protein
LIFNFHKGYFKHETELKKNNLPTIKQNKLAKITRKDSTSVPMKKRDSKKVKPAEVTPSLRTALKQPPNESKALLSKDSISKRQRLKRDTTAGTIKNRFQSEFNKLKADGDIKYLPKLSVETPFMAKRIRFVDKYNDNDMKWNHRYTLKEEYMRRDQLKQADKFMKTMKVVYDLNERSPFYNEIDTPYIDDKLMIPNKEDNVANNARLKNRGFRRNIMNSGLPKNDKFYTSLNPYYIVQGETDNTLVFESRFESGNLKKAIQCDEFEYDLFLRNDYNSQGYVQWYYFSISNVKAGKKYVINIKNFFKPDSLYNQGLKPLFYSTKKAENEGIGWYRGGEDICYYQNSFKKKTGSGYMCNLSFSVEFSYDNDEVYICHCFPFTYRDCKEHVDNI